MKAVQWSLLAVHRKSGIKQKKVAKPKTCLQIVDLRLALHESSRLCEMQGLCRYFCQKISKFTMLKLFDQGHAVVGKTTMLGFDHSPTIRYIACTKILTPLCKGC